MSRARWTLLALCLAWSGVGVALSGAAAPAARADDLRIGLLSEPTSLDPHFHNLTPNDSALSHIFERLVSVNEKGELTPALAESWSQPDDKTWRFKLRSGVKWHDGSPFSADDVVFTFERAPTVPGSPSNYASAIKGRVIRKIDDLTIELTTASPDPLMLNNLSRVFIISRAAGRSAKTADYNTGKAAIGTGPYKFSAFEADKRFALVRNDAYWGGKQAWEKIELIQIADDQARVAALVNGDVDMIEDVPTASTTKLRENSNFDVVQAVTERVIYLHLDQFREKTPFATAKDGAPLANPLKSSNVRKAFSKAINRDAIVARVMSGAAIVAGQYMAPGFFGTAPTLKPEPYDPEGAKKLLAEAGLPAGFKLTLHTPAGRYANDVKVAEAIAQMFQRIGVDTTVSALPPAEFFARASSGDKGKPEFSVILAGRSSGTGEASDTLNALVHTVDPATGAGAANRGRFSDPDVDRLVEEAQRTIDVPKRAAVLAEAATKSIAQTAVIPIYFPVQTWGVRKGLTYKARADEYTLGMSVGKK